MRENLRNFVPMIGIIKLLSLIGSCIVVLVKSLSYAYIVMPILFAMPLWVNIFLTSFFCDSFDFFLSCFIFVCAFVMLLIGNLLQLMLHYLIHYII